MKINAVIAKLNNNSIEWVNPDVSDEKIRRPKETEVIDLFIGHTQYHQTWKPRFKAVLKDYPEMIKWLGKEEGAGSDLEVWKKLKPNNGFYSFSDLKVWIENGGTLEDKKKKKKKEESNIAGPSNRA